MATLNENAAAVKAAAQAIDAAIVAKGGETEGGLNNAAAAIEALPSGGAPAYPHPWVMKDAVTLSDDTHLWFYFEDDESAYAYFFAQFSNPVSGAGFFTVDWGDGTTEQIAVTATLANKTLSHRYLLGGEHHVVISGYDAIKLTNSTFSSNTQQTGNLRGGLAIRQAQFGNTYDRIAFTGNCYGFGLRYIAFQNKATSIGNNAFASSPLLREIDLSECETIGNNSFYGCTHLASIDLSACTSIGSSAFISCTSLTSVGDLSACTSIGYAAFSYTSITGLELPVLTNMTSSVRDMKLLETLIIPVCESVSFIGCESLHYIYMPACREFGASAFQSVAGDIVCDFGQKTSADVMAMTGWTNIPARRTCVVRCADGDFYRSGSTLVPLT